MFNFSLPRYDFTTYFWEDEQLLVYHDIAKDRV
jgi:hypothetical protein